MNCMIKQAMCEGFFSGVGEPSFANYAYIVNSLEIVERDS